MVLSTFPVRRHNPDDWTDLLSLLLQDMAGANRIDAGSAERRDALPVHGALRSRAVAIKIWARDGTIVDSSDPAMTGRRFPPDAGLAGAFDGSIVSEINSPPEESAAVFRAHIAIFEVYAPAKRQSRLFTYFVLSCNVAAFFAIVHGGNNSIERQKDQLTQRIDALSRAMERETVLRDHIERAAEPVFDQKEKFLRTPGAVPHDGPAQSA